MAIKLIARYSKTLGLPGYSSHQFSVSVETELVATDDVAEESARIYRLLQTNVDEQILHTGFVPPTGYGMDDAPTQRNGSSPPKANGNHNGQHRLNGGNGHNGKNSNGHSDRWFCSDKQKELILKLVDEHGLDRNTVEDLAQDRFGEGVKMLNKLQASGLIAELIETADAGNGGRKGRAATPAKGGSR